MQRGFLFVSPVVAIVLLASAVGCGGGAPGAKSSKGFGTDGKVLTRFGSRSTSDTGAPSTVAIQRDGKIIAAGQAWVRHGHGQRGVFALARYNSDGSLDDGFGKRGEVVTGFGRGSLSPSAIAVQGDGKIVVVGASGLGDESRPIDFALARYLSDGRLDPSFGDDGKVVTHFGSNQYAESVVIQRDGKIVAVGGGSSLTLARYTPIGRLDASFGDGGEVLTRVPFGVTGAAVVLQGDGKIVAAGGGALARYLPDGTLDRTFGDGGKVLTGEVEYSDVAIQSDGKIVAAGYKYQAELARYTTDGTLDQSFGTRGRVENVFSVTSQHWDTAAYAVVLQSDGKIVAAGDSDEHADFGYPPHRFALARYTRDGTVDPTFGARGKVLTGFGETESSGNDVWIQADGKIVVAGTSDAAGGSFALARYRPDGRLDAH
jgi:uncharacterized delta-60 repeat protein